MTFVVYYLMFLDHNTIYSDIAHGSTNVYKILFGCSYGLQLWQKEVIKEQQKSKKYNI